MIQPIKDNRKRKPKPKKNDSTIRPKPEWVEAFLILLLHKNALLESKLRPDCKIRPELTISLKSLDDFCKLKTNNKTQMSYDPDSELITIRAPKIKLPKRILRPSKKIITEIN